MVFSPLIFLVFLSKSCLLLSLFQMFILQFLAVPVSLLRSVLSDKEAGPHGGLQWELPFDGQHYVGLPAWPLSFCPGKRREPREVAQRKEGHSSAYGLIIWSLYILPWKLKGITFCKVYWYHWGYMKTMSVYGNEQAIIRLERPRYSADQIPPFFFFPRMLE